MFEIGSKKFVYLIASVCFISTLLLVLLSKGTYDPGDGVQHYLIAKYAIKYPLLFLDHWGKPVYTLLCMPFAQGGFLGSNIYNLLCNTATSLCAYSIAHKMGLKNAWVGFLFVFYSPLLFMTNFSGLTEPTFALILTGTVLLFLNSNFVAGALLISFLPFARTEGFFIIPLFGIYLITLKQWKALFFCGFATVLYSIIGGLALGDFLWIMHQNPYKGAVDIYGKGPLLHFVAANDRLFGLPLVVLFLLGCTSLISDKITNKNFFRIMYILVLGSFIVYFVMHSVFWWKGLFGSLGLHRVMAGVAPMVGIIALSGFNFLSKYLSLKLNFHKIITSLIVAAVILYPFKQYRPPLKPDTELQVLINTSNWIKSHAINTNQKVYCMYPMLGMLLNVDPFDHTKYISTCMLKYKDFSSALQAGDLILWDSHFGNECGFLPSDISVLPRVKKIASFNQINRSNSEFEVVVYTVAP